MTRKQWFIIISAIILLIALTFGIIKLTDKQDREEDAVEDIEVEQQEQVEQTTKGLGDLTSLLGSEDKVLTRNEIEEIYEKEKEKPGIARVSLENILREEYGDINYIAFVFGHMVDDADTEFDKYQMLQQLLAMVDGTDLDVIGGKPLITYINGLGGVENEKKARPLVDPFGVEAAPYLFVNDSKGFKDVDGVLVGYPRIGEKDVVVETASGLHRTGGLLLEVDVLVKETIPVKDVIDKYTTLPIEIDGEKVLPLYETLDKDTYLEPGELVAPWFYNIDPEKSYSNLVELAGLHDKLIGGIYEPETYKDQLQGRLSKSFLKGGIITVQYEIPAEVVVGDYDLENDLHDYFKGKESTTFDIKIGEEEFILEYLTEDIKNIGIYYRE